VPRFAAIKPPAFDAVGGQVTAEHPRVAWTHDGVMQVGTAEQWQHVAHAGLIEVPDGVSGAAVSRLDAEHHEHIHEWWRSGPKVCVGVIGTAAVSHAPDDGPHALVLGTAQAWGQADWLWGPVRTVRVPPETPGMALAEHEAIVRPVVVEPAEDEVVA
jgi:hypothetical protein